MPPRDGAGERLGALLGAVIAVSPQDPPAVLTEALDRAASALIRHWAEGAALLTLTDALIARLWTSGWQPADVERMARRDLTPRHARIAVDLIASEARRHPAPSARWQAQLDALGAAEAPPADAFPQAVAERERTDRFTTATLLFETARLLGRLPRIQPLSAPRAQRTPGRRDRLADRMLERVRALLAKAESTEFPEEAEALTAKAQQLMALHSIDAALLDAESGGGEVPEAIRIGVDAPYEAAKAALLNAVGGANRCTVVWSQQFGFCTVVGFAVDLEAVELLHTSLLVQATAALTEATRRRGSGRHGRTRAFRQSFLLAYAHRIAQRLAAATADATSAVLADDADGPADSADSAGGSDLLPVLAAREAAVRESADRLFPDTTSTRMPTARDWDGWVEGTTAADRATLTPGGPDAPAQPPHRPARRS